MKSEKKAHEFEEEARELEAKAAALRQEAAWAYRLCESLPDGHMTLTLAGLRSWVEELLRSGVGENTPVVFQEETRWSSIEGDVECFRPLTGATVSDIPLVGAGAGSWERAFPTPAMSREQRDMQEACGGPVREPKTHRVVVIG